MIQYRILGGQMRRGYWEISNVMKITGYELVFFLVFFFHDSALAVRVSLVAESG